MTAIKTIRGPIAISGHGDTDLGQSQSVITPTLTIGGGGATVPSTVDAMFSLKPSFEWGDLSRSHVLINYIPVG